MPYGCGEQNMIFLAPDIEVLRYLKASGQLNPEVRAKAEHFITTGYQRELTYRTTTVLSPPSACRMRVVVYG
jgi:CD109 antigen